METSYRCDKCGTTFDRKTALTNHLKTKISCGEDQKQKLTCMSCKKVFARLQTLQNHQPICKGEKEKTPERYKEHIGELKREIKALRLQLKETRLELASQKNNFASKETRSNPGELETGSQIEPIILKEVMGGYAFVEPCRQLRSIESIMGICEPDVSREYTSAAPISNASPFSGAYHLIDEHKTVRCLRNLTLPENLTEKRRDPFDHTAKTPSVYFIIERPYAGKVKIGFSIDPKKRLIDLQIGASVPLEIYRTIAGAGRDVEAGIHRAYDAYRIHGEWFRLSLDQIDEIFRNYSKSQ